MPDDEQKTDPEKAADDEASEAREANEGGPSPPDEAPTGEGAEDRYRPEAIAARVDRIGQETESDRLANEEEKKLLERKRTQKKKGLEAAASKRLSRIGEGKVRRPSALGGSVSPDADPLLERAARAGEWIKEHRQTFGALVAVVALGAAGLSGYSYWQDKRNAEASALLAQAMNDQHGQVSDKDPDEDDDAKARQLYPTFKTAGERRDAALSKYRAVESKYAGTGAAILARLAEGSLLLDAGDAKGASSAYEDVKSSALGQADGEVRGRAFEGIGFADELLAQSDAANKDKHLDDARSEYEKLEHVDVNGFKELGLYHQARVVQAKGDKARAIELLKDVQKRVSEPGETHPFPYLQFVVEDRLRELDPTALPPKAAALKGGGGGMGPGGGGAHGPGGLDTSDPQVQKLIEQLRQQGKLPPAGAPGMPPMPPQGAPPEMPK
ncbi:MAG TPA: tetratricopeptide repeat protein [Polyangiaceae bacterium]|nr:tetratricopeptide repeat protein [Polyangiaceae bacterium]